MNAGITALALSFPASVRRNTYWTERYPDLVANAHRKTLDRLWRSQEEHGQPAGAFDVEMAPYLADPFRGTLERRVLSPGETALSLELAAARDALRASGRSAADVGLLICCSFLPDSLGVGNAAFLAGELGLTGAAWNVESACSSSLVALQSACALVSTGAYRIVLVVVSCTYSRAADEVDTLSWTCGDGAAAFLVEPAPDGGGLLSTHLVHTASSCGSMYYEIAADRQPPGLRMRADAKRAALSLREISEKRLPETVDAALERASLRRDDIDFFVFNTPLAWYAAFCARALGIDRERTINCYPLYANVGPVLMPANLFHAAHLKRIRPGDLVLLYSVGSVSSAGAAVLRWGEVALGTPPGADP